MILLLKDLLLEVNTCKEKTVNLKCESLELK